MAAGVRANISLSIDAILTGSNDLGNPKQRVLVEKALAFIAGTAATDEANILFSDTRTLAASATEDLDLAGVLASAFGATITAAEVVAVYFAAAEGNTNNVNVTRPASNGFIGPFLAAGDGISIKPGEWQFFASESGWPVTAATGDLITVTNSGGTTGVTYDVLILGRTVAA
jgi:hypothetical protein